MAATTLDRNTSYRGPIRTKVIPIAVGQVIPKGVIVSTATPSAGAVNATDTAGHVVQGISDIAVSAPNGDIRLQVARGRFCFFHDGTITAANIGAMACVLDNQTVTLAATATNDILAGEIEALEGTNQVWIDMTGARIGAI